MERAVEVAERIRAAVANTSFSAEGEPVSTTISIGISIFSKASEDLEDLLVRADKKLYESKHNGMNTVSH
jgi:diguanylate cyclase